MTVYELNQDPTIFITPTYFGNKFVYRMAYVRESNRVQIRNIDLRKDKLMVHGTEIKESKLQRLHDSLTLRQKQGHIYVNCNGACCFLQLGTLYKPIHNVIFDWSPFDVVVPNSINQSLRKELKEKDDKIEVLNRQLLSTRASNEEAKNEAKGFQEQVLAHVEEKKDKEMELKHVRERLSLVDFELESNKIELELSKNSVLDLQDQLSTCKNECQDIKNELQNQLSLTMKANNDFVIQLRNLQEQLSSTTNSELNSTKTQLHNIQDQLESTKVLYEGSKKEAQELKDQSSLCKEEHHHINDKVRELSDDLNSIDYEVKSSNRKLEQVLTSMLWNDLVQNHQLQPRLLHPSIMGFDSPLEFNKGTSNYLVSCEDEAQNLGYMVPHNGQVYDAIKIEEIEEDNQI